MNAFLVLLIAFALAAVAVAVVAAWACFRFGTRNAELGTHSDDR